MSVEEALKALRRGDFVLVFDGRGREEETDFVVAAEHVKPEHIRRMRTDGGGLICTALHADIADKLGIPFITEVLRHAWDKFPVLKALEPTDIPYDERSAFSITINHRKTFTGITDRDRALTIRELAKIARNPSIEDFGRNFRSPGHVILLKASPGLLKTRRGHTELSVTLTQLAGLTPVSTICEMLAEDGYALSYEDARRYARRHGLVFLEGYEVVEYAERKAD